MTGQELKRLREGIYISKLGLAKAAKLSPACITRWEREDSAGGGFPLMSQEYIKSVLLRLAKERYLSCRAVYEQLRGANEEPQEEEEDDDLPNCVCGTQPMMPITVGDDSFGYMHIECPSCGLGKDSPAYDCIDDAREEWERVRREAVKYNPCRCGATPVMNIRTNRKGHKYFMIVCPECRKGHGYPESMSWKEAVIAWENIRGRIEL